LQYININGKLIDSAKAGLPVDNGAFRYGYGLFETLLVRNGSIALAASHMERLFAGMLQLRLGLPPRMDAAWLQSQVLNAVAKNKLNALCRVRLQVFAGGGGLFSTTAGKASFVIECFELAEENTTLNENGLVMGIAEGLQKSADSLGNLKTCNALIYAMAARQAKENKWNDAFVCNTNGHIIESTIANTFWIKAGLVYTPPLPDGCIAGVMRRYIMEALKNVTEQHLSVETLADADEVFITNAIKRVKWVGSLGNKTYGNAAIKKIYSECFPL
jgi:branched-chain amino acid aminotransferase